MSDHRLTDDQCKCVLFLPAPRAGIPALGLAKRSHSDCWRKGRPSDFITFVELVGLGICETKVSRNERLFRLTKPSGIAVRQVLKFRAIGAKP